ncbi:MAG: pilus (MSHA type) biogenesis protein MshL [Pseudomonadota bacterium]|nr:pilus (MSHA type) biogenesis protein MshL [Gammaproteobacteria bacterium]
MIKHVLVRSLLVMSVFLLSACTVTAPHDYATSKDAISQALRSSIASNRRSAQSSQSNIPSSINEALMPDVNVAVSASGQEVQKRFDISVDNVSAKDFFMGLVKDTKYNIVISPEVKGSISLHLKSVTIPEVLEAARDVYGYEFKVTSYGYRVMPRELTTRVFTVNYLDLVRKGKSLTSISSGEVTKSSIAGSNTSSSTSSRTQTSETRPSAEVASESETDLWKELKANLDAIIGTKDGRSVVINREAGIVIVHAYPDELREVAHYLDNVQNVMGRQVVIEAKVLEVQLNAKYQSGINWNVLGLQQIGNQNFSDNMKLSDTDFTKIFSLNIHSGTAFATMINLLNMQGKVNVLSSPHIATTNNEKAVIKVGKDEFFVTNVSNDTSTGSSSSVETQDVELTPFFSGIALDVTPEISQDGLVTLHIHPVISKVEEQTKTFTVGGQEQSLPLAKSTIRESDSIVKARNGQVIVIGGLMEDASSEETASTPGASHVPIIGDLLSSHSNEAEKFELVILLRPIVVGEKTWTKQLKKSARVVASLPSDFKYEATIDLKKKKSPYSLPAHYEK